MAGFIYKNKSTETILSAPLSLGVLDNDNEHTGLNREIIQGETTISRPAANTYGTRYTDPVTLEFCLWKSDGTAFSASEQRVVNAWLTSPKYNDYIEFINTDNEKVKYRGLFTDTSWLSFSGGIMVAKLTFQTDSQYCWEYREHYFSVRGSETLTFDCDSDELEEYVYPTITVTGIGSNALSELKLENITDGSNTLTMRVYDQLPVTLDCRHCMVTDDTANGIVDFSDLGWTDVGNIYWPRLLPGENSWKVTGEIDITVSCYVPHKRLGAWL